MQIQSLLALLSATAVVQDGAIPGTGNALSAGDCRSDVKLLNTATIPYENSEVIITTYSLPSTAESVASESFMGTQDMCGVGCKQMCQKFPRPSPVEADCAYLANFIKGKSGSFVAGAHTNTTFQYRSCVSKFLNRASNDYQHCYGDWGSFASNLVDQCMPHVNGAACVNRQYHWGIEISGPGM